MFFRKKRRSRQPSPPWVTWLLVAFIIYAVVAGQQRGTPDSPNKIREAWDKAGENLNPDKLLQLDEYKKRIFPGTTMLRMKEGEPGEGMQASCGQEVAIAYDTFLIDEKNTKVEGAGASKDKPLIFRLGDGTVMPALDEGVTGMRKNGTRNLLAPPNTAYGIEKYAREDIKPDASVRIDVTLLTLSPELPDIEGSPYRIATLTAGGGKTVTCGEPMHAHITVWSTDGKKLYSTKDKEPLTFTPGKSEVFLGLEQGVLGMNAGGTRLLVVPPSFQKTMHGNPPAVEIPLSRQQTVLVDVEAIP